MNDVRTKIATLVVVLGLGGLGGYAMSSNRSVDTVRPGRRPGHRGDQADRSRQAEA